MPRFDKETPHPATSQYTPNPTPPPPSAASLLTIPFVEINFVGSFDENLSNRLKRRPTVKRQMAGHTTIRCVRLPEHAIQRPRRPRCSHIVSSAIVHRVGASSRIHRRDPARGHHGTCGATTLLGTRNHVAAGAAQRVEGELPR